MNSNGEEQPSVILEGDSTPPKITGGVLLPPARPPQKPLQRFFTALLEGLKKGFGVLGLILKWFLPRVLAVFLGLILFGGWIQTQPLKKAAGWVQLSERRSARSWCQSSASSGWVSYGMPYPPNAETPSVRIAPRIWCNAHSPTKGVALKMKKLFPHLG